MDRPGTGQICLIGNVVVRTLPTGGAEKGPCFSYAPGVLGIARSDLGFLDFDGTKRHHGKVSHLRGPYGDLSSQLCSDARTWHQNPPHTSYPPAPAPRFAFPSGCDVGPRRAAERMNAWIFRVSSVVNRSPKLGIPKGSLSPSSTIWLKRWCTASLA